MNPTIREVFPKLSLERWNKCFHSGWYPRLDGQTVKCKLWQILPCKYNFFFNGRVMFGPGRALWIYLVLVLIAISSCFVCFDMLPFYQSWPDLIPGILLLFFGFIGILNLIIVCMTDPGYVVPHWFSDQQTVMKGLTAEEVRKKYGYASYCNKCKIFRSPDTSHCNECRSCIDGMDHHCFILGTCVGKRNFRSFYIFMISANLAMCLALVISFTHFIQNWYNLGLQFAAEQGATLYLILSTLIVPPYGLVVLVLLPFSHTRNIYNGETLCCRQFRKHVIKHSYQTKTVSVAFSQFCQNFYNRVIKTPPPSRIPVYKLQQAVEMPAVPRDQVSDQNCYSQPGYYYTLCGIRIRYSLIPGQALWPSANAHLEKIRTDDVEIFGEFIVPICCNEIEEINSSEDKEGLNNHKFSPFCVALSYLRGEHSLRKVSSLNSNEDNLVSCMTETELEVC